MSETAILSIAHGLIAIIMTLVLLVLKGLRDDVKEGARALVDLKVLLAKDYATRQETRELAALVETRWQDTKESIHAKRDELSGIMGNLELRIRALEQK